MLKAILERLKEGSTWAGIGGFIMAMNVLPWVTTDRWQTIATAGAAVAGLIAMFLTDSKTPPSA